MKSIGVVINARMASTRCPQKHLRILGNKTVLDYCLEKVNKLKGVEERNLAVYDKELAELAKKYENVNVLWRQSDAVKKGNVKFETAFRHYKEFKTDYVMIFNPCQPFLPLEVYQNAIDWFHNTSECRGAISVKRQRGFFFNEDKSPINLIPGTPLSTQISPPVYVSTFSFSFFEKKYFIENGRLWPNIKGNPYPYEIPDEGIIDIDTEEDFAICKALAEAK